MLDGRPGGRSYAPSRGILVQAEESGMRWPKSGPPGLGFRAAHGHGCTDVCCNPFKVLGKEDCDINEVEEESVKVVDVTIDSAAGRNVWPKEKKVPGKIMPLKK